MMAKTRRTALITGSGQNIDQTRRERFQSIPTKLELPHKDVDLLIDVASELLNEDPEFHHLLQDLGAHVID